MGSMKNDYYGLSGLLFNPHGSCMGQIVSYTECKLTGMTSAPLNQFLRELTSTCDCYGRINFDVILINCTLHFISQLRCRLYTYPDM
uniref:Uncharacterized protein n=1 Tax=Arundo donax TaxID=35708 RepID=A0A0A9EM29_ARUDO